MHPDEIVTKQFNRAFRGYDIQEVDLFLDEIICEFEQFDMERKKNGLVSRVEELIAELKAYKQTLSMQKPTYPENRDLFAQDLAWVCLTR